LENALNIVYNLKLEKMKNVIFTLILFLVAISAKSQLVGTKWKGNVNLPNPTPVIMNFQKDVAELTFAMNGSPLESASYSIKKDTIIFKKLFGGSPCAGNSVYTVKFSITDDKLSIVPIADECEQRLNAWTKEAFVRVKE